MFKRFTLCLLASISITGVVNAQHKTCGTASVVQNYYAQHPEQLQAVQQFYQGMDNTVHNGPKAIRSIPVVFHVIYNTTAENISATIINQAIDQLNLDYRKLNNDVSQVRSQFTSVVADAEIQFCLATVDPNGAATTGIVRSTTNKTNWSISTESNNMKDAAGGDGGVPSWNFRKYLNVWIVDLADYNPSTGGTAGYAYLPGLGPQWEAIDGIVMDYQVIGTGERTLTHEVGHYLGLSHPWEDEQGNASCNPGDGISDTPPTSQETFTCPASQTRCSGQLTQWENFMDYSSCSYMFTVGQANKMNNILSTNYNLNTGTIGRGQLVTWSGCGAVVATLNAAFTGTPTTVTVGNTVSFTDQSTGTPTSWTWSFPGGSPSTFTGQTPPAITYNTAGVYTVTLTVSDGTNSDTQTSTNYITVTASGGGGTTGCDTLFYFDGFYYGIDPSVSSSFAISLFDNDGLTPNATYTALGITTDWSTFYDLIPPNNDTDFYPIATSWFDTPGQADNWITFGPLTAGTQSSTLSWYHLLFDNDFRDGYEVLVNTTGDAVADFNNATVIASFSDQDAATDGDTIWTPQTANLPSQFNGQNVYIAFHHNANDMALLSLDEFIFSKCDAATASLNADFVGTPLTIPVGSSVNFTDLSTGSPTTWTWSFPGGTPSTFTGQNPPAITYNTVGFYNVSLTVSDGTNSDTQTNSVYVNVTQTITTTTDTCFVRMITDLTSIYIDPLDSAAFNINFYDEDGFTADANVNPPFNGDWQLLYSVDAVTGDTNDFLGTTSFFTPVGQADNWFTFGPLTVQNDTVRISWSHRYPVNTFRDAYSLLASPVGPTPANFQTASLPLFSVIDNDPSTNNDTVWTPQQILINASAYLNSQIYLAFHHTGNDQLLLFLDDIIVEDCDTINSTVVITNVAKNKAEEAKFSIVPNPSNGEFFLNYQLETKNDIKVIVADAIGRTVYSTIINNTDGGMLKLPLETEAAGVYSARILQSNQVIVKKLVIQK